MHGHVHRRGGRFGGDESQVQFTRGFHRGIGVLEGGQHVAVIKFFELGATVLEQGLQRDQTGVFRSQAARAFGAAELGEQHRDSLGFIEYEHRTLLR